MLVRVFSVIFTAFKRQLAVLYVLLAVYYLWLHNQLAIKDNKVYIALTLTPFPPAIIANATKAAA